MKTTFHISGIRNDQGFVRGVAFTSAKGFPEHHNLAVGIAEAKAKKGTVQLTFDIEASHAAFAFFHDEKDIKRVEKTLLGLPKGGIVITNWNRFSKPKFASSLIQIAPTQKLKIKYF